MTGRATVLRPFFVYGTLMLGQRNALIWQGGIDHVEAATCHRAQLYDYGFYPIMVEAEHGRVLGQLITIREDAFDRIVHDLDALEGYDPERPRASNFRRILRAVVTPADKQVQSWTYVGRRSFVRGMPRIESGDWRQYAASRNDDAERPFKPGLE